MCGTCQAHREWRESMDRLALKYGRIPISYDSDPFAWGDDTTIGAGDGMILAPSPIVLERCEYCRVRSPEFDICPHCGAPRS